VPAPLGADDESNLVAMCASCHRRFDARRAAAAAAGRPDTPGFEKGNGGVFGLSRGAANSRLGSANFCAGRPAFGGDGGGIFADPGEAPPVEPSGGAA
jgi:hypothetical protein